MIQTTVYYDECFQDHVSTLDYPECSDRVKNIIDLINKEDSVPQFIEKIKSA